MKYIISFLIVFLITVNSSYSQTCSCAGAPLLSSQSQGTTGAGGLLIGLTYEYHDISAMYSGSERLNDKTVSRLTQSVLLEISYGITERISVSGTFSFVDKDRTTGLHIPGGGVSVNTNGLGDGVFTLHYQLIQPGLRRPYQVSVGKGVKIPFGTTSLKNNGFTMNADMQPGTGAWDGVVWGNAATNFKASSTFNLFLSGSYRYTGSNERFAENDNYRFGNEFVANIGASDNLWEPVSYMLGIRYRSTSTDRLNGNNMSNTGGKWVSLVPALNYQISDMFSARLSGQIPVYQNLSGTQPTTGFAVSGSIFISFNRADKNNFRYGAPD